MRSNHVLLSALAVLAASGSGSTAVAAARLVVSSLQPVGADAAWAWLSQASACGTGPCTEAVDVTLDGGRSWLNRTPPGLSTLTPSEAISQLAAVGPEDAWVSYGDLADGSPRDLTGTSDGGLHWARLGRLPSPYCSLQFVSSTVGWCTASLAASGYDPVIIYRSADGGRHWELESRSSELSSRGTSGSLPDACDKYVSFSSPTAGWAAFVCPAGRSPIYGSTDSGRTWVRLRVGPLPDGYRLSPGLPAVWTSSPVFSGRSAALGLSVEGDNRSLVYASTDHGNVWRAVAPPGRPREWFVDVVTPSTWKLIFGRTVLTTTDGGHTWRAGTSNVALAGPGPQFFTAENGWYVPLGGSEIERTNDGGLFWHPVAFS